MSGSTVYAGGDFNNIGGQSRSHIAALDAISGLATAWNPGADNIVFALAVSGSTVYAGGYFGTIGGQSRSHIAALDATSGLATTWNPGASSLVYALAVSGSTVYAGGVFTSIGGQGRGRIAALDATTGLATAWNPGADGQVQTLAVSGSTVQAGGEFTSIGGQSRSNLAELDAATGLATAFDPGANQAVYTLVVSGSTVYAAGDFDNIGGQDRSHIAALDLTGLATTWNPGADAPVFVLALNGTTVYAGGNFTSIGGLSSGGFAALRPDASAPMVQVLSPNGSSPLLIGTQRHLDWSASDDLAVQSVDLYLSRTGPAGPWELLAAAAPNTGSYLWTVTGPEVPGNNAYLLVAARDYGGHLGTDICNSGFSISSSAVDVEPGGGGIMLALSSPAPNPTTDHSVLSYAIPSRTHVHIALLDVRGREVAVLFDGLREAGHYTAAIEAAGLRSGMYFAHLRAGDKKLTRRVVVVR